MADDDKGPEAPVTEPAEKVAHDTTDTAAEVIPDPVQEVTDKPDEDIAKRVDSLSEKVDGLIAQLAADVDPTDNTAVTDEVTEMPRDGGEISDESPAKPPWTHRPITSWFGYK